MAQRRHHYERAFEGFLRARRIPYVAVDEARKALIPEAVQPSIPSTPRWREATRQTDASESPSQPALKSFDFVIYGDAQAGGTSTNLLVDIKGRRLGSGRRLESWVTLDDIDSLTHWERLFGPGFQAAFVFVYECQSQPPDALFQEVFEDRSVWYALRAITLAEYAKSMKLRSPKWRTVDLPRRAFDQLSHPFAPAPGAVLAAAADPGPELPVLWPQYAPQYAARP